MVSKYPVVEVARVDNEAWVVTNPVPDQFQNRDATTALSLISQKSNSQTLRRDVGFIHMKHRLIVEQLSLCIWKA